MLTTITLKNRLYHVPANAFALLCNHYARACSFTSKVYFDSSKKLGVTKLHNKVYYPIRKLFGLKAQEADSVPRTVKARYKAVDTQMSRRKSNYPDKYSYYDIYYWNGNHCYMKRKHLWYHYYKSTKDLWNPIHLHSPQADLVYKNDWRILPKQHRLSINTLGKRAKVKFYLPECYQKYLKMPHKLGTAKLIHRQSHWYLYVSCTVDVPQQTIHDTCGIDRGQRFLYYAYNNHQKSNSLSGLRYRKQRSHFLKQRKVLQHKHTRKSKCKLRTISGKENCWMTLINHRASKALVQSQTSHTLFILENLRGIRFTTGNAPKHQRYGRVSWSFYDFGNKLAYKASLRGLKLIHINPYDTSQRCPKCGQVLASNRHHDIHKYQCQYNDCGYTSNDDRIGGMNIRFLGVLQELGYYKPKILDNSKIKYYQIKGNKKHYAFLSPEQAIKIVKSHNQL